MSKYKANFPDATEINTIRDSQTPPKIENRCRGKHTATILLLRTRWQFRLRVFRLGLLNQLLLMLVFSVDRS